MRISRSFWGTMDILLLLTMVSTVTSGRLAKSAIVLHNKTTMTNKERIKVSQNLLSGLLQHKDLVTAKIRILVRAGVR